MYLILIKTVIQEASSSVIGYSIIIVIDIKYLKVYVLRSDFFLLMFYELTYYYF